MGEGDAFFSEGIAIVACDTVTIHVELVVDGDVIVIGAREIGWVERYRLATDVDHGKRNFKRGDGGDSAVEVDDGLNKAGHFRRWMGVQAVSAGISGEVKVKGAVFLEEDEDVLDLFAEEFQLGLLGEDGFAGGGDGPALDLRAGGRRCLCFGGGALGIAKGCQRQDEQCDEPC